MIDFLGNQGCPRGGKFPGRRPLALDVERAGGPPHPKMPTRKARPNGTGLRKVASTGHPSGQAKCVCAPAQTWPRQEQSDV